MVSAVAAAIRIAHAQHGPRLDPALATSSRIGGTGATTRPHWRNHPHLVPLIFRSPAADSGVAVGGRRLAPATHAQPSLRASCRSSGGVAVKQKVDTGQRTESGVKHRCVRRSAQ